MEIIKNPITYLDNNATTRVDELVVQEMLPFFTKHYGNSSSMHQLGGESGEYLDSARMQVAKLINAKPEEILFTSGGTESDNTAIHSALKSFPKRKTIVTSQVEHPAILTTCKKLEKQGYIVHYIKVNSIGQLDIDEFVSKLSDDVAIVSLMWANNETGTIFPIRELAKIAKEKGILFHTDAVQAVGKVEINVNDVPVDMLSLSGHKIHAPKGVGALYIRHKTPYRPFVVGGHQEGGRRGGTENIPGIVALGKACEIALTSMEEEVKQLSFLRDSLEAGIISSITNTKVNGDIYNRLPGTLNISFESIEGEGILLMLDRLGICASSGSACTSGSLEPSHVLMAMNVPFTMAHGSIRFSFSKYNTLEDVQFVITQLPPVIEKLRQMSPFWQK